MSQSNQTICLNMIVRNECRVIERCLNSVMSFVDHWVIVDTGSTDGTQQLIRECMRNVPGELIERPWVDFAHNRSEALEFARGKSDYILVVDADEVLVPDDGFTLPQLTHDAYYLKISSRPVAFWRVQLFRNTPEWCYESPIHEYLKVRENATYDRLHGLSIESLRDGWRAAQPGVYQRDAEQLLHALEQEPNEPRTNFYLGQSYAAAGELELALKYYQRSVEIDNWPEQRWLTLCQIAETKQRLEHDWSEVLAAYLEAYQYHPHRAEPLYRIALYYRWRGAFHLAHLFLQQAVAIPYPREDYLHVDERLYRYLIKMALATCCYHIGQYEAGLRYCDELLENRQLMPPNIYQQIEINRQQCAAKIAESSHTAEQWPKVKVFIGFRNTGPNLDNCIERLLDQTCVPFEAVFLDLGSTDGSPEKIPTDDPRVKLVRRSDGENIWSFVAGQCDENDIVLLLNDGDWLASEEALAQLQRLFGDPGCLVTYGQFQYADGAAGLACWIPDIESERVLTDDWRCTYPLACRGSLLKQVVHEDPDPHAEDFTPEEHVALARKLFAAAGSAGVRFNAEPICVYDSEQRSSVQVQSAPSISKNTLPTISCLTVTLNRLVLLKESIQCYCNQTYPNRELIIVTNGTPRYRRAISDYIDWLGRDDIRLVYIEEPAQALGKLRNVSLDTARSDIVCQWDDDDLNHPERLERQFNHLRATKANASCFTDHLQFFFPGRSLFWSDWRIGEAQGIDQLIPGTLMTYSDTRFRYPETTPYAARGEDSVLLYQIAESGTVGAFENAGYLYVYSYHGKNVFPEFHHRRIAVITGRSLDSLREQESILREALLHYRLPEPYTVRSGDGQVMFIQNGTLEEHSYA